MRGGGKGGGWWWDQSSRQGLGTLQLASQSPKLPLQWEAFPGGPGIKMRSGRGEASMALDPAFALVRIIFGFANCRNCKLQQLQHWRHSMWLLYFYNIGVCCSTLGINILMDSVQNCLPTLYRSRNRKSKDWQVYSVKIYYRSIRNIIKKKDVVR